MWQSVEILSYFKFNFERDFLENKNLFHETGVHFLSWKHEDWKRMISIPYQKQKLRQMMSTKSTYHKERSFASNYFIILNILFQFKNLL